MNADLILTDDPLVRRDKYRNRYTERACAYEPCSKMTWMQKNSCCCSHSCAALSQGLPLAGRGENNHNWTGDDAGYSAKHHRLPRATSCAFGCEGASKYENAHILGEVGPSDEYTPMCRSCHAKFDAAIAMMFKPVVTRGPDRWRPHRERYRDRARHNAPGGLLNDERPVPDA
jgi:hypothetical protein